MTPIPHTLDPMLFATIALVGGLPAWVYVGWRVARLIRSKEARSNEDE